ncbi:ATP-binding cassette domain-containing protein [Arthrobacter sp. Rue61a]|uniref:ATP-binding cassette domain-containing protein n=1 Tax=Arthrobacter sp. Rue61a TaxID=1118963 RepID=UPI00027DF67A|nr:ATP-binding cassette domain-containing protein [Arthrobacter sp. Rue61a]AFR28839.1 hypothetical protein ARUE_c19330 [Arthrobacter sp. Rue61a]
MSADRLVKKFGDLTAVEDVSFAIRPSETYGFLGPNGAGKTTIINMVAGLIPADSGSVDVAGIRMDPGSVAAKRNLGLVPKSSPSIRI